MLNDIVIDTNVLVHANNPQLPQSRHSKELILLLLESKTQLCVDRGFDIEPARNRSQIGGEYLTHLQHGMIGYTLVVQAATHLRIKQVSRSIEPENNRILRTLRLPSMDMLFVKVARNSLERVLTSHDDQHFSDHVRDKVEMRLDVNIIDARMVLQLIDD